MVESGFADITDTVDALLGRKPVPHPAKFTDVILEEAAQLLLPLLPERGLLYDPFAGVGKGVDFMYACGFDAYGTELEPEWADQSEHVGCCNSLSFMRVRLALARTGIDVVFTSPAYGNRMADHHDAKDDSVRNTYRHTLGRELSENSSAGLQWGPGYRDFHTEAWELVYDVLKPGGYFLLNVKNFIRHGNEIHVTAWHVNTLIDLGFEVVDTVRVPVTGNGFGANRGARVTYESLVLFRKPE